jgi:hypothetical protein
VSYMDELVMDFVHRLRATKGLQLHEVLEDWIELGDIIEKTGGDFSLYQAAVIRILLAISEREDLSEAFERPLLDFNATGCMERGFWDAAVFRRKYGTRAEQ